MAARAWRVLQRRLLLALFLFALVVRLAYLLVFPDVSIAGDTLRRYDPIAHSVVDGKGYAIPPAFDTWLGGRGFSSDPPHPTAIAMPGFPLYLAFLHFIFGHDFTIVRILGGLMDAGSVALLFLIGRRVFSPGIALLASLALALYPLAIYNVGLASTETPFTFLLLLAAWLLVRAFQAGRAGDAALAGLALGAATLVRPAPLALPPFLLVGFWLALPRRRKQALVSFLLVVLMFGAVLSPWFVRNFRAFNAFVPGTTISGLIFFEGVHPELLVSPSTPRQPDPRDRVVALIREREVELGRRLSEAEVNSFWFREGLDVVGHNPLGFAGRALRKTALFWYATDSGKGTRLILGLHVPTLALAALGLGVARKRWRALLLPVLLIGYFVLFHIFLAPALVRYATGVMPLLLLLAAAGAAQVARRWSWPLARVRMAQAGGKG